MNIPFFSQKGLNAFKAQKNILKNSNDAFKVKVKSEAFKEKAILFPEFIPLNTKGSSEAFKAKAKAFQTKAFLDFSA